MNKKYIKENKSLIKEFLGALIKAVAQRQANKLVRDLRKQSPENAKAIDDMHKLASDIRDRIKQIEKWSHFTLTREKNNSILKALPFVTENSKIYLTNEDKNVSAELTDKKLQNVDSYTALIGEDFVGDSIPGELILDVELFRLISTLNFEECKVYINNEFKMLKLDIVIDSCNLTFVSTSFKN